MLQIVFFLCAITATQNPVSRLAQGVIVTTAGSPLGDVAVLGMPSGESVKSNGRGEFVLMEACDFIRFSAPGFRPKTISRDKLLLSSPIVMQRDSQAVWVPRACSSAQTIGTMRGEQMEFILPEGTTYISKHYDDYSTNIICQGTYCLEQGWGPLWSWGLPPRGLLEGLIITEERDIQYRPGLQAVEYRGTRSDGTMTRWVGKINETICYENVPADAAEFFDKIIDTLCWVKGPFRKIGDE